MRHLTFRAVSARSALVAVLSTALSACQGDAPPTQASVGPLQASWTTDKATDPEAGASQAAPDEYRERFDAFDATFREGRGYAAHPDSATLAWAEAYFLQGYLNMYRSYRDARYLDKLVEHANLMFANLSDPDGDGYRGWQTTDYTAQRLVNRGFEQVSDDDPSLPAGWTGWNGSRVALRPEAVTFSDGKRVLDVFTDQSRGWRAAEQFFPYVPGQLYEVSFYGKTNGVVDGRVDAQDATTGDLLGTRTFSGTTWGRRTFRFRSPNEAGHKLRLQLYHSDWNVSDGVTTFDEVSVRLVSEYLVHDGHITDPLAAFVLEVYSDPSLARYRAAAERIRVLLTDEFIPKWEKHWSEEGQTYLTPTDETFEDGASYGGGTSLPHNQYLPFANVLLSLGTATSNARWLARANALATTFRKTWSPSAQYPGAATWNYADRLVARDASRPLGAEDTSHGSMDAKSVLRFSHAGVVFSARDRTAVTSTLLDVMWNPAERYFGKTVASNNDPKLSDNLWGWSMLAEVDGRVWDRTAEIYRTLTVDDTHLYRLETLSVLADWNPERLVNRGFAIEAASDKTLPARWSRSVGTSPENVFRSTAAADRASGTASLVVKTTTDNVRQGLEQPLGYVPGRAYLLELTAKTDGRALGLVEVADAATGRVLAQLEFGNTEWAQHAIPWFAPDTGGPIVVRCSHGPATGPAGGTVHFDSVEMKRLRPWKAWMTLP
ncbi:MAG: hypothetical protein IPG50_23025 [Myxococcales bacterium]|nr:hypothetical protein [Myxococcales bacterium]